MNPKVGGGSCGVSMWLPSVYGCDGGSSSSASSTGSSIVSISQMVMPKSFRRLVAMFFLGLGRCRLCGLG